MLALGCDHGGYELMQEVKKTSGEEGNRIPRFRMQQHRVGRLSGLWQKWWQKQWQKASLKRAS